MVELDSYKDSKIKNIESIEMVDMCHFVGYCFTFDDDRKLALYCIEKSALSDQVCGEIEIAFEKRKITDYFGAKVKMISNNPVVQDFNDDYINIEKYTIYTSKGNIYLIFRDSWDDEGEHSELYLEDITNNDTFQHYTF